MQAQTKYLALAEDVAAMVDNGTLRPGDVLPSVREISRRRGISISTVLKAYYLLEARGLVEARPRSGFYVSALPGAAPEPEISHPGTDPTAITVRQMVDQVVHRDVSDRQMHQFGAAFPCQDLSATGQLNSLVSRVAKRLGAKAGEYAPVNGVAQLRNQVARHALNLGCNLRPEDLIITVGCAEAVSLCLRAVCRRGDVVAVESPVCFDILLALEVLGLKALEIPTHPSTGISLDALKFAVRSNPVAACILSPTVQNPLGSIMPEEARREFAAFSAENNIPLICDEAMADLHYGPRLPLPLKSYDKKGLVMWCGSFSKAMSLGCRIGWVEPGRFRQEVLWLKYTSTLSSPTLNQHLVAEFLGSGAYLRHLRKIRPVMENRTAQMRQAVTASFPADIRVTNPKGGFLLWLQLGKHCDSLKLYEAARQRGIAIAPGHLFSAGNRYRGFIRLNTSNWTAQSGQALVTLGNLAAGLGAV